MLNLPLPQTASCKPSPSAAAYQQDPGVWHHSSYPPQSDAYLKDLKNQHNVAFRYDQNANAVETYLEM